MTEAVVSLLGVGPLTGMKTRLIGRCTGRVYAERDSRELALGAANIALGPDRL
jgi:hypothetical protein